MRVFIPWIFALGLVPIAGCGEGDGTGSSGSGSGGGTSSASGTGGMTVFDPPGAKDPDAALKAAVFMGSCIPELGINHLLNQIYAERESIPYAKAFQDTTSCFASKANGCKAVAECIGMPIDATGPCARSCEGTTSVGCNNTFKYRVDCAKLGLACSDTGNVCVAPQPAPACDPATYMESCADGKPHYCPSAALGEQTGLVCADYGVVCGGSNYTCIGSGPACNVAVYSVSGIKFDVGIACDGTNLRACVNGFEHLLDCGTLAKGFTCQTASMSSFCGLANACELGLGVAPACEGDNVVVCNGGRVDKVDCKTLGFTGCDPKLGVCTPNAFSQP